MKIVYSIPLLCAALMLAVAPSQATADVLAFDNFTYADGSLITVSGGKWVNHSGTDGDLLVANEQAVVQHGTPSEDAHISFSSVNGDIFYGIDFFQT